LRLFGEATQTILSMENLGKTGVDEESAMLFGYSGGRMAVLFSGVRLSTPQAALVLGTDGRVEMPPAFWQPREAVLVAGGNRERIEFGLEGNGYNYEAEEVGRCLREGRMESAVMPLDETVGIMETLDRVREQWGLRYPME
jgi:hypothetical protein